MNSRMYLRNKKRERGVSMIEVMVAAVVLATGLLALASLQAALSRNAADARARSQVASFLDLVTERQRAAAASGFVQVPSNTVWSTDELAAVRQSAGASDLAITVSATHYRYDPAANGGAGGFVSCDATCAASLPPGAAQYKEVRTLATWSDATGAARRLDMTSTISPRTVADSITPLNTPTSGSTGGKSPVVRTNIPSDAGIIPIAIGSNTETAATNPKPKVTSGAVVRTSFEVLTYRTEASSAVQQKRVETAVIGCKCSGTAFSSTNPQFATAQWPAYWNGNRYVVYKPENNANPPGASAGRNRVTSGVVQDELCLECCRDHHDSAAGGVPKFDPIRFAAGEAHQHYKYVGGALELAGGSDAYEESCRMIRVDGFWRTAADFNSDYFNLLATKNDGTSTEFDPSAAAQSSYQDMVIGYLNQRYTNSTTYNTPLSDSAVASLEMTHSINEPQTITIPRINGTKWLHARGLYLDWLEPDAIDAIAAAKAKSDCSGENKSVCVLPLVPVTAVNVTELAEYVSASTVQVGVENNGFAGSTLANSGSQAPRRGKSYSGSNPTPNSEVNVTSALTPSNSGLAVIRPIDPLDAVTKADTQQFRVEGSAPPDGSGGTFTVVLNPYTFAGSAASYPVVSFSNSGGTNVTCNRATSGATVPNPYTCTASTLGVPTTIKVSNYNYQVTTTSAYSVIARCKNNKIDQDCPFSGTNGPLCGNWAISSPAGGSILGEGKGESTTVSYASISAGDQITIAMDLEGTTRGTTDKVTFQCNIGNGKQSCSDGTLQWLDVCQ